MLLQLIHTLIHIQTNKMIQLQKCHPLIYCLSHFHSKNFDLKIVNQQFQIETDACQFNEIFSTIQ